MVFSTTEVPLTCVTHRSHKLTRQSDRLGTPRPVRAFSDGSLGFPRAMSVADGGGYNAVTSSSRMRECTDARAFRAIITHEWRGVTLFPQQSRAAVSQSERERERD